MRSYIRSPGTQQRQQSANHLTIVGHATRHECSN
jgi:hypothetical protein